MHFIFEAIQNGDFCGLVFFSAIVIFVGDRMINSQPAMRIWGLRITAVAFVGFTVSHISQNGGSTPSDLALAAIIGLLGGIVTLGPVWILLSIVGFLGGYYRQAASSASSAAHQRQLEREKKAAEKKRLQEQIDWERNAPERERVRQEESERRKVEAKQNMESQKRRTDARADCEMLFQLYAIDISSRFPREALDEWIKKYMDDDQSPDDVEQRAEQLRKMIIHHREAVKPTPKFNSLSELAVWFQEQRAEIESLPVADRVRRMLFANLNIRNSELMNEFLGDS